MYRLRPESSKDDSGQRLKKYVGQKAQKLRRLVHAHNMLKTFEHYSFSDGRLMTLKVWKICMLLFLEKEGAMLVHIKVEDHQRR